MRHLPRLIEHLEVCLVTALRFAGVSDFDHQIDIRSLVMATRIGQGMARVVDPFRLRPIQTDLPGFHQPGLLSIGQDVFERNNLSVVSGRIGIGDVFGNMPYAVCLCLHGAGRDLHAVENVAHLEITSAYLRPMELRKMPSDVE